MHRQLRKYVSERRAQRTPSPQRGEGWGEGARTLQNFFNVGTPSSCPSPLRGEGTQRAHLRMSSYLRSAAILSSAIVCSAARSSLLVEASGSSSTNQTKRGCW